MINNFDICIESEIGQLEGVILHAPGLEVENMTPGNVERALYSDILNLAVATEEYSQLKGVLGKVTQTFFVRDLLTQVLANEKVKETLVKKVCRNEEVPHICDQLLALPKEELATQLIQGVVMEKNSLSRYLSKEYYILPPLHNFFFTRDSAIALDRWVLVGKTASQVRERETIIMEAIFDSHPSFNTKTVTPPIGYQDGSSSICIEGGDVLVAREDILLIGIGARSTAEGVDFVIENLNKWKRNKHIIVQELPHNPESFIHLDMVFTFLDVDKCMVYEPVMLQPNRYRTVHITLDNGKVASIREEKNLLEALKPLGMDLEPVFCGGSSDSWLQEREQWHSGANFFAMGPGQVIGYGRNVYTIEEMNKHGFEVIDARKVIKGKVDLKDHKKYVVTMHGAELPRGGGGCRCMTMPIKRQPVQ